MRNNQAKNDVEIQVGQKVIINGKNVMLSFGPGVHVSHFTITESDHFLGWVETFGDMPLLSIHVQNVDMFGPYIGFLKVVATLKDVLSPTGCSERVALIRGNAVAVALLIKCEDELYYTFVRQDRVPVGVAQYREIPAGMTDMRRKTIKGAAISEIEEETGIKINFDELIDLLDLNGYAPVLHTSPGITDEGIGFFASVVEMNQEQLDELHGKLTGCKDEGENIVVEIGKFNSARAMTTDLKSEFLWLLLNYSAMTHPEIREKLGI